MSEMQERTSVKINRRVESASDLMFLPETTSPPESDIASDLLEQIKEITLRSEANNGNEVDSINQNIMENRYELSKDISNDGEKTRALITSQYEINLQRQLADANAAIIELRNDGRYAERSRGIEVNTTTTVNQMQQQQQQQQQYSQLAGLIYSLGQNIQNSNAAINVGSGTQTSTPTNTNTNIR